MMLLVFLRMLPLIALQILHPAVFSITISIRSAILARTPLPSHPPHPAFYGSADYVMPAIDIINLYLVIEPIKWANNNNSSGNLRILLMPD